MGDAPKEVVKANIDKIKSLTDINPLGSTSCSYLPLWKISWISLLEGLLKLSQQAVEIQASIWNVPMKLIIVIPVVLSVSLAKRMEKIAVDAVIAEGMEALGGIGKLTTMTLVRHR